jgi:hypothetical protein
MGKQLLVDEEDENPATPALRGSVALQPSD